MKRIALVVCLFCVVSSIGCAGQTSFARRGNGTHIRALNTTVSDRSAAFGAVGAGVGALIGRNNGSTWLGGTLGALAGLFVSATTGGSSKADPYQDAYDRETDRLERRRQQRWDRNERMRGRLAAQQDYRCNQ